MNPALYTLRYFGGAHLSTDEKHRYSLHRRWSGHQILVWVMLNPSTADAKNDDPTIRRVIGFSKRENAGGCFVCNLFSYRATKPSDLLMHDWRALIGREWKAPFEEISKESKGFNPKIIVAWGTASSRKLQNYMKQAEESILKMIDPSRLYCLGKTKDGSPRHPLYIAATAPLMKYNPL